MFSKIFGQYLLDNNYILANQWELVNEKLKSVRVKLGLIAVTEGMMSEAQADNVNRIQAMQDKRFGDIAVEKGYLTEEQVSQLLKKQGNSYIQFVQVLVDENILSLDDINKYIEQYKEDKNLSDLDMDMLKSGDTNKEILVLVNTGDVYANKQLSLAVRNVIRFIDSDVVIKEIKQVESVEMENFGYQLLEGDFKALLGFGSDKDAIVAIANGFAKEAYTEVDEDSYDAVCEFTNCINGLFATELSEKDVEIDMLPPASKSNVKVSADNLYVMELLVCGVTVQVISAINTDVTIE